MPNDTVSATTTIPAAAEAVFAVLADPTSHPAIDGTGWVVKPTDDAGLTTAGQVFGMAMYHQNHPDGDYEVLNRVTKFAPPHTIAWETGGRQPDGELEFGGWRWRYDLAEGASGTDVTLSYDWSAVPAHIREYISFPPFGPEHLTNSLSHLAEVVSSRV
ncbi:MAG: SRPBCC family protein [Pseudonocardia sp.]|nr:SRPBCC family protein [Pseudonocardia sp.]